jgi:hypothetical protein
MEEVAPIASENYKLMKEIINKLPKRNLSQPYLNKISRILRDRWKETLQAIQHKEEVELHS